MEVQDLMWTFCKEHQKVGIYRDFQTLLCEHPVVSSTCAVTVSVGCDIHVHRCGATVTTAKHLPKCDNYSKLKLCAVENHQHP